MATNVSMWASGEIFLDKLLSDLGAGLFSTQPAGTETVALFSTCPAGTETLKFEGQFVGSDFEVTALRIFDSGVRVLTASFDSPITLTGPVADMGTQLGQIWASTIAMDYFGGPNADHVSGGDFQDVLRGRGGSDLLYGARGNDKLYGGADADVLIGGDDNDVLGGNVGQDVLIGGRGNDTLYGGSDVDAFVFTAVTGNKRDMVKDFTSDDVVVVSRIDASSPYLIGPNEVFGGATMLGDLTSSQQSSLGIQLLQAKDGDAVIRSGGGTMRFDGVGLDSIPLTQMVFSNEGLPAIIDAINAALSTSLQYYEPDELF